MRICPARNGLAAGLLGLTLLAGCSTESPPRQSQAPNTRTTPAAPAPASAKLVSVPVDVPGDLAQSPLDEPRQALIPDGWSMSVWARIPKARLEAWTPDGALLVSVPASGQIMKLTPKPAAAPEQSTLLEGLDRPHGIAFAGSTLYVAESDQIDAYDYANGAATNRRTVAADLPDARSPELHGAYAHALKSVAVGPDGAVYFSIGSTGNISADDRNADPPRATIMRIPPGGGLAAPFATGVRNGTGLAVAPDGSVWTAVNNRDNAPDPDGNVDTAVRQRASAGGLGAAHPWPRIGLALLQSRRRPGQSAVHPRHVDEQGRLADGLRRATAGRAEHGRPLGAAGAGVHRRVSCRSRTQRGRWSAYTAHGTGSRRERPRCRSSLGVTAIWATSRLWWAASRPTTVRGGAAPSRRWSDRTAPCTSPMTTPAPSTDLLRRER